MVSQFSVGGYRPLAGQQLNQCDVKVVSHAKQWHRDSASPAPLHRPCFHPLLLPCAAGCVCVCGPVCQAYVLAKQTMPLDVEADLQVGGGGRPCNHSVDSTTAFSISRNSEVGQQLGIICRRLWRAGNNPTPNFSTLPSLPGLPFPSAVATSSGVKGRPGLVHDSHWPMCCGRQLFCLGALMCICHTAALFLCLCPLTDHQTRNMVC